MGAPICPPSPQRSARPCSAAGAPLDSERHEMATYVLIHGAYQGGWIWKPVATRLRAAGHLVFAPSLDGCGERSHPVLAGTSSGGMVIVKAAELARERIGRLAFVDALALMPGERVDAIVKRPAPNDLTDVTTFPSQTDRDNRVFRDLDDRTRAWAMARITPHPIAALEAPMEPTTFWEHPWPTTVIRCRRAVNPPEHHQRRTAERLKAEYHELDTGHYPMLSEPAAS